ncbi:MAG TPA: bile acid:sodium symporter family protein [Nevskiaceae bacterium]|nr:bile acid:sodium symporter family protein [Nevskiaceae bacterium]
MLKNPLPDPFVLLLVATIAVASLLPAEGWGVPLFSVLTKVAIAVLFFLHGAKLSRESVVAGATHWRLHLCILASTYVMFPLLAIVLRPLLAPWVTPALYAGVVYLCVVPSTVQSSIVLTAMGRGNVSAAVCSASVSNLLGVFLTPLLAALLLSTDHGGLSWGVIGDIVSLLLVPFGLGQALQRWVAAPVKRHASIVKAMDKGMLMLIIYTAFSASVREGLWHETSPGVLAALLGVCVLLLFIALNVNRGVARLCGFAKDDEVAMVFCGSKKSLASGIPIAQVLFATHGMGALVLPLMIYHPLQLTVCTFIARHYARRPDVPPVGSAA